MLLVEKEATREEEGVKVLERFHPDANCVPIILSKYPYYSHENMSMIICTTTPGSDENNYCTATSAMLQLGIH